MQPYMQLSANTSTSFTWGHKTAWQKPPEIKTAWVKKKLWSTSLIQLYHSFLSPNTMCWTNAVPTSDSCWGMHRFRCSKRSCQTPSKCNNSNRGKMLKQNKFYQLKECTQPIRITFQQRKGKFVKMIRPRQPLKEYKVKLNYGYQVLCSLAQARWLL